MAAFVLRTGHRVRSAVRLRNAGEDRNLCIHIPEQELLIMTSMLILTAGTRCPGSPQILKFIIVGSESEYKACLLKYQYCSAIGYDTRAGTDPYIHKTARPTRMLQRPSQELPKE